MKTLTEPFKIKMVEPIKKTTEEYRENAIREAHYNPFQLHASDVFIDLLTDSGTNAMSSGQWSALMNGDESYAGAASWERFNAVVYDLCHMDHIFPTHQGRAAERILYGVIGGKGKVFISNTHFDTTRANIEYGGAEAIDIVCKEGEDLELDAPFKGNINLEKLDELIQKHGAQNIGAVVMTVTNNSSGGQPVSLENIKAARKICDHYHVLLVIDGCRIAENSYFIKHREKGYENKTYKEIAQEILSLGDVFVMSAKKDAIVNIGGILAVRDKDLADKCMNLLIIGEGFSTYGGLSGRDMEAIAVGLTEVFDKDYLQYRIRSTAYLGEKLKEKGIPIVYPIGGHAIYIDAKKLYPNIPLEQFPGQALVIDLYVKGGIRSVEIGSVMFGRHGENGAFIPAANELVRLAIPRRVYTQSHIDYVAEVFDEILKLRDKKTGYRITHEPPFLRHFTAYFEPVK